MDQTRLDLVGWVLYQPAPQRLVRLCTLERTRHL